MAIEIERKFLVRGDGWRQAKPRYLAQGYLNRDKHRTVRVRIGDDAGFLTIKGITAGASRREYEYPIPRDDAKELLALCDGHVVEKFRHVVDVEGSRWEVDEFLGDNNGLVLAEIELASEDQQFSRPAWLGPEVTEDPRYFNSNLAESPWCKWVSAPSDFGVQPAPSSGL